MTLITVVANFKEYEEENCPVKIYSGLRDPSIPNSIANALEKYYEVERIDISKIPSQDCGISRVVGNDYPRGHLFFIVQNHLNLRIDVPDPKIIYFHVDGAASVIGPAIKRVIKVWCAAGVVDYKLNEEQYDIFPFIDPTQFNPNREKDLMVSDVSTDIPYLEYKDLLERSCYLLVHAHHWLSKRPFQAAACRTIPIVVTRFKKDCYEKRGITTDIALFRTPGRITNLPMEPNEEMADRAYEWVLANHTIEHRIGKIVEIIEKVRLEPI